MTKKYLAFALILVLALSALAAVAENTPADDEIVKRVYTLENAMETPISALYVYESREKNLVPDGLKPGEQVQVHVAGYYNGTPNQTPYTVEFVAGGETYAFTTLHVEDVFNVLYLKGTDAVSGATPVSFMNPDGTPQQVEAVETPAEDEIVERIYTLENAMDADITELYVYQSKGENLVPDGMEPGAQVQVEVFGYYTKTPNATPYTVEFITEGEKYTNNYRMKTLHVEDSFEVLYLTGADAVAGATPVSFVAPEK